MPTLEELLTATRSAVQELEERKRSLQQALDYKNVVQQALDTEWNAVAGGVVIAHADVDAFFRDTLTRILDNRVGGKRNRKLLDDWKAAAAPPAFQAEPDTEASPHDGGSVRRRRKAEMRRELEAFSATQLLERLEQAETERRQREQDFAIARDKVSKTHAEIRSRDRHWRVIVGLSILHHADQDPAFRTSLDQVFTQRVADSDRPLLERWRNRPTPASAPSPAKDVLTGWVPRKLADKQWGAALLNPAGRTLPAKLVGASILVSPRNGDPWVTRITAVAEKTDDRILVRHEGHPSLPSPAPKKPASPSPDDSVAVEEDASSPSGTETGGTPAPKKA